MPTQRWENITYAIKMKKYKGVLYTSKMKKYKGELYTRKMVFFVLKFELMEKGMDWDLWEQKKFVRAEECCFIFSLYWFWKRESLVKEGERGNDQK
jgi:hypothetical protein